MSFMRRGTLFLLAGLWLSAQTPTATLVGRVEDATGAVIPGAGIQVRNVNTNLSRKVMSGAAGDFTVPNLAPGKYHVTVECAGFKRLEQTGLELQVDQTARLILKMQVGALAESIEVTAAVPAINTENAVQGEVIVSQELLEMPLDGRDFGDLAYLVPGVDRTAESGQGSGYAVNGARSDNTNFVVDGFNNQDPRSGDVQARPPLESMQEFKMQTTGYSAEFGRLAGGVVNMALKSGANQPHGSLFEFLRNDQFDARNFFVAQKAKLRRNQFGGTLSGPVTIPKLYSGRDRTFFLFSWESYRETVGLTRLGRVPTDLERQGDFSQTLDADGKPILLRDPLAPGVCTATNKGGCFPNNRIPADRISPISQKLLAYYPQENRPGQANNFIITANQPTTWDNYVGKIDQRLSAKDSLSFRILRRGNQGNNVFKGSAVGGFGSVSNQTDALYGLTFTRTLSPTFLNEFRAGLTRTARLENGVHAGHDYAADLGIPGTSKDPAMIGFPAITVTNMLPLGDDSKSPIQFVSNNLQWADTFTWVRGPHLVKFGADVLRAQFFQLLYGSGRGTFQFLDRWTNNGVGDFLLGYLNYDSITQTKSPSYLLSTNYGFFAQDDYKVSPRITLNLGLRYEIMKPVLEKYGRISNFLPHLGKIIVADDRTIPNFQELVDGSGLHGMVGTAREFGLPASLTYTRYRNFAPRFGMAWRPFGGNRSVVRGGYGVFFGNTQTEPIRQDLTSLYPFVITKTYQRLTSNPLVLTLANPFPEIRGVISGVSNASAYELYPPSQYLQSWNLAVERELGHGSAVEIAYVGSKGTHLSRRYDLNQPFYTPQSKGSLRPYAGVSTINYYSFGSNSTYNAGLVTFHKRFSRGFFYRANYIYSKSIDNASQVTSKSAGGYQDAQNARNLRSERGRSDWNNGHAFTMNFSCESPFRRSRLTRGWQLAASGRMYTGQPFTPQTSNADLNNGEANRPDRSAKGMLDVRTPERWFEVTAFPLVPRLAYRYGNSGRGILDGPGFVALNTSLSRRFHVREAGSLQFRWELFNVSNHTNFRMPNVYVNAPNGATITQANPARQMQVAVRYQF